VVSPLLGSSWDLSKLDLHNAIEHDASLTRNDFAQGDNYDMQLPLLQALLDDADGDYLTVASLAKSRARREQESLAVGSGVPLPVQATVLAFGESALLLQIMGKTINGELQAAKSDVWTWFNEERLPDGWKPPLLPVNLAGTTLIATQIQALAQS